MLQSRKGPKSTDRVRKPPYPNKRPSQPGGRNSAPLFALLIGINKYKSEKIRKGLSGAVNDVKAIKKYLETRLGVPKSQIKTLCNHQATRDLIIKNMYALRDNPKIRPGDPILIFYAGHGTEMEAPPRWESGGKIQLLLSHDALCEDNGRVVSGIPDRTIGVILEQIAEAKGNNITVIFDCCHSGSLTRNDETPENRLVRGIEMKDIELHPDLDRDIWTGKGACGAGEKAAEANKMGVFTRALLGTLADVDPDKVTYADLIQRIPSLPQQSPQCEGHHQDRICFNSRVPSQIRRPYNVRKDGDKYVVDAGAAHGITIGATFDVYEDRDSIWNKAPICTLITCEKPGAFVTILGAVSNHLKFDKQAVALLTRVGEEADIRIHVLEDYRLKCVDDALKEEMETNSPQQITLVQQEEAAQLQVAFENDQVVFNILDPAVTTYGMNRIPFEISPKIEELRPILRAAAHYYWHLRRSGGNPKGLHSRVQVEFKRLEQVEEEYDDDLRPIRTPCGNDLICQGVIDLVVDKEAVYGIKITNKSQIPLYTSVFFFDNSNLSITSYFQPGSARETVDPPIPPEESLTIGYGAGGARPFKYVLGANQDIDVGFVKLFLSTTKVDLSNVPQASPFSTARTQKFVEDKRHEQWDTILFTVVQRRNPPT